MSKIFLMLCGKKRQQKEKPSLFTVESDSKTQTPVQQKGKCIFTSIVTNISERWPARPVTFLFFGHTIFGGNS